MARLMLQAETLSGDALHDVTRDLCNTLNREADVEATLAEEPPAPGARGAIFQPIIEVLLRHGPEVLAHGSGVILGESVLMILRPYFERNPGIKATLRGEGSKELILGPESVNPENLRRTARDVGEILNE